MNSRIRSLDSSNPDNLRDLSDVTIRGSDGQTILHEFVRTGNLEKIKFILDHESHLNAVDKDGKTPLYVAVENSNVEATKLILRLDGDPSIPSPDHRLPISVAVANGNTELVKLLADFTPTQNRPGVLQQACLVGSAEILSCLLSKGFPTFTSSHSDKETPWNKILFGFHHRIQTPNRPSIVRILLENGTQFRELVDFGKSSLLPNKLHLIHSDVLRVFLDFGLAELQWESHPGLNLMNFSNIVANRARRLFDEIFNQGGLFDGDLEDSSDLDVVKKNFIANFILYLKYLPLATLSRASVTQFSSPAIFSYHVVQTVSKLTELCRWTIRRSLVRSSESVTPAVVETLRLPNGLVKFLCFKST